jgi:hypothetical protein
LNKRTYKIKKEKNKKKILNIEKKIMDANESLDKLNARKLEKLHSQVDYQKKEIKDLLTKYDKIKHNPKKETKVRSEIEYEREKLEKLNKYINNDRQKELENLSRQIGSLERKYLKVFNNKQDEMHIKYERLIGIKKAKLNKLFSEEISHQEKVINDLEKKARKEKIVKKAEEINDDINKHFNKLQILKSQYATQKQNELSIMRANVLSLQYKYEKLISNKDITEKNTAGLLAKLEDEIRNKKINL